MRLWFSRRKIQNKSREPALGICCLSILGESLNGSILSGRGAPCQQHRMWPSPVLPETASPSTQSSQCPQEHLSHYVCVVLVPQACLILCNPMDGSLPDFLLSMGFSRQEYLNWLPFPSPCSLPNPGIELKSPELQVDSLPSEPPVKLPTTMGISQTSRSQRTLGDAGSVSRCRHLPQSPDVPVFVLPRVTLVTSTMCLLGRLPGPCLMGGAQPLLSAPQDVL